LAAASAAAIAGVIVRGWRRSHHEQPSSTTPHSIQPMMASIA